MSNIIKAIDKFSPRKSLAPATDLTEEEIKTRWRKHIAEISKHLSTKPNQSEDLTFEQQEWLNFRMSRPFPKPYRWIDTKTEEAK